MENPKLALIPSGYKSGKVYSILPNDATSDFDYERNGNASRVRKDGLIEELTVDDTPRLDWLNSNCPSLLLEPQRTNLQVYSEQFDNATWSKSNSTIEANSIISPNGELTADKLIANTVTTSHFIQDTFSGLSTSSEATFSIFVKKAEISQLQLLCSQNTSPFTNWARLNFDLDTLSDFGTTIGTFGYEDYGNGWIRVFVTGTPTSTSALIRITLYKNFSSSFTGNNIDGLYLFGAQVEQGKYATSYIKTEASTVTRLKDECLNGGDSDLFDITEGSWFLDLVPYEISSSREITIHDGTNSNRLLLQFQSNNTQVRLVVVSGGSIGVSLYEPITINTRNKILVTFKENEFKVYINGTLEGTDTSGNIPTGLDTFNFSNVSGSNNFEGKLYDTRVYDRVLTNAEAIELTTL
jgi:hypothetical protein